jgi:hypothetical protein
MRKRVQVIRYFVTRNGETTKWQIHHALMYVIRIKFFVYISYVCLFVITLHQAYDCCDIIIHDVLNSVNIAA